MGKLLALHMKCPFHLSTNIPIKPERKRSVCILLPLRRAYSSGSNIGNCEMDDLLMLYQIPGVKGGDPHILVL